MEKFRSQRKYLKKHFKNEKKKKNIRKKLFHSKAHILAKSSNFYTIFQRYTVETLIAEKKTQEKIDFVNPRHETTPLRCYRSQ